MTKRSTERASQLDLPEVMSSSDIDAITRMTRSTLTAMAEFNGRLCERAAAFNAEWAQFLARRLEDDIALPQRLNACKSPEEAQEVYVGFWTKALREYQEEFVRLAQMGQRATREAAINVEKCTNEMTQEARLN